MSQLSRRAFIAGTAAAAAVTSGPASAATRPKRPNILLIVTDDHRKETEWAIPSIVSLIGGQGVDFSHGCVTTPLCSPSRSSIMTGRLARHHGVVDNSAPERLDQDTTVQSHLRAGGYRTGLYGKYLNAWDISQAPPHFDDFAIMRPAYRRAQWNVNGTVGRRPGYTTTLIRQHALAFMRANKDDPWFLYLSPYASHGPNTPEDKYADLEVPPWDGNPAVAETDKSDKPPYIQRASADLARGREVRQAQLRTLRSVDDMFKAIRAELVAQGKLDDTLIIFIGDNGFSWAEHGHVGKSVPYRPAFRVPFYLSWPAGGFGQGRADDRLAANIDIAPTILDAAGIAPRGRMDGFSLLTGRRRDLAFLEYHGRPDGTGPGLWAAVYTGTRIYTEYYDGAGEVIFREYYDLGKDPHQLENLLRPGDRPPADLAARLTAARRL
ncbi:sulfatase family protein [Nonomuraea typhae]|uniref:sulfatase family protein n=1 Tax=Nonomuraea typhae TaxID=2603600 RepID=UPI0012FB43D7|nr:sulfatase [Nonomuraea typhae]